MQDLNTLKERYKYDSATPMMQQYFDIKFAHMDSLLLFRMGDFYELFLEDAITASRILGIALAKRGKHDEVDIPMCGVPYHALESYLHKLVEEGHKVAICEQLESPVEAKKRGYKAIVKRDVVRIITQGTITEESILNIANPNYLISVVIKNDRCAIGYLDISTSEFGILDTDINNLANELFSLSPKEILISENIQSNNNLHEVFAPYRSKLVYQVDSYFAYHKCKKSIEDFYNIISTESLGEINASEICAAGSILEYIRLTQKNNLPDLPIPQIIDTNDFIIIDASTRRNLEITTNLNGGYKNSLLSTINHTITKQGSRLLYQYLSSPLSNIKKIEARHNITEFFYDNLEITENIRQLLKSCGDLGRIVSKVGAARATAKDLLAIKDSLLTAEKIKETFVTNIGASLPSYIEDIVYGLSYDEEILEMISNAIREDAPNDMKDGGFIKTSYHSKLVALYEMIDNSSSIIDRLKQEYQKETGVDNLRICHNNILGLFIEITPKHAGKITDPKFIHRQSIATAIRFTTNKLQEIESQLVNAKTLAISLEHELFSGICSKITLKSSMLHNLALQISKIDLFTSLAFLANENNYVKPQMTDGVEFTIKDGRHPVVELNMPYQNSFIANDCDLSKASRLWLITGPNMAGKSTFLRQNALIVILAQMGSFVPASSAVIGVVDKIFSRIGAADDLSKGQSTFMVEMIETSAILSQSTARSLIILDEVGRGTSTYDGLSIAWGCLEYIHNKLQCRSLFATHYHELTILKESLEALSNYTIKVSEVDSKILFLHQIIKGIADKSYGLHVAELAGLPKAVISRAKEILKGLEDPSNKKEIKLDKSYNLFEYKEKQEEKNAKNSPIISFIEELDPNNLSPKEALDKIYEIKKLINASVIYDRR